MTKADYTKYKGVAALKLEKKRKSYIPSSLIIYEAASHGKRLQNEVKPAGEEVNKLQK